MAQRKSSLNPYATPYVPLSKFSPQACPRAEDAREKELKTLDDTDYQLPASLSFEYDIQNFERLRMRSESSSSNVSRPFHNGVTFPDGQVENQAMVADANTKLEYLSAMFPYISVESLAELLWVNHGNLNMTVDVLQQLEHDDGESEVQFKALESKL